MRLFTTSTGVRDWILSLQFDTTQWFIGFNFARKPAMFNISVGPFRFCCWKEGTL